MVNSTCPSNGGRTLTTTFKCSEERFTDFLVEAGPALGLLLFDVCDCTVASVEALEERDSVLRGVDGRIMLQRKRDD